MGWDGNGDFDRSYNWVADRDAGIDITASRMDGEFDNYQGGLENCITRDGQNSPSQNLPMNSKRHTGVANANARDNYAAAGQVQDGSFTYATDTGSANAYAIAPTPSITAYVVGQKFRFLPINDNTGASTLAVSGLSAQSIVDQAGSALSGGELITTSIAELTYNGTAFILSTPATTETVWGDITGTLANQTDLQDEFDGKADKITGGTEGNIVSRDVNGNIEDSGYTPVQFLSNTKNSVINGCFRIWQRGTSFSVTTAATYSADRWRSVRDGSGATVTVSRQSFTVGQTDVPGEPEFFIRHDQTVAGSGGTYNVLSHFIEGVRSFAGESITVSFYAKADASRTVGVNTNQYFGSGGSTNVYGTSQNANLTTSWQKFELTFTMASISGKTISGGDDRLEINLSLPLNVIQTIDIARFQVEKGSTATEFERRSIAQELQFCKRYFQRFDSSLDATRIFNLTVWNNNNNAQHYGIMQLPVTMRKAATVSNSAYTTFRHGDGGSNYAISSITISASTDWVKVHTVLSTGVARPQYVEAANTTNAYINLDAEF